MRTLIIFSAMMAAVMSMPSGIYGPAPAAPQYQQTHQQAYYAAPAQAAVYAAPAQAVYAQAAPSKPVGPIVTGTLHHTQDTYGQYKFGYESSDGQAKTEAKQGDGAVQGSYSYVDPDGQRVDLEYTAGKDGFRANGEHLPKAPAVPDLPEDLASAYQDAHNRLAAAYEEARLRGDTDLYTDDGSFKAQHEYKHEEGAEGPAAPAYASAPAYPSAPAYAAAPAPVRLYQAAYPAAAYPAKTYSAPAPAAPAYVAPAAPAYSAPAQYSAPAAAPAAPAYSSSSYSTAIGGTPVALPVKAPAKSGYAYGGY